ncbi:MAG TPA: tRNA pseudouridine(55) synthase TruB, partial [Candidatus Tumulicola sp.]|nr:tRNA pseudouridine(55) synthase TruB [Candidatus Tumulicola sp.]
GKATRLIPLLTDRRKAYACTIVFGRSTATYDALGETVSAAALPAGWPQLLESVLPRFTGKIEQIAPMFSAIHHEGKRLYEYAREGKTVDRRPRSATIYALSVLGTEPAGAARLRVACSEGTYVRALCHDIGAAMGVPAHMGALVREASGPFVLYESLALEEIAEAPATALIAPDRIIPFPTIVLDLRGSADFRAGRVVPLPQGSGSRHVFVRDETRTLVGVGEALGALLAPRKVFV